MTEGERLLEELAAHAGARRRVPIEDVWPCFRKAVRGYTGNVEARAHLRELLDRLAESRSVELPRSERLWDRSAEPALPTWVQVPRPEAASRIEIDHRTVAWPPELAFVAGLRRGQLLDELLMIRRFLAEGGRERIPVPVRERSIDIFGDEKRLDALMGSSLFGPGRLSIAVLRCYEVAPPLVWESGPAGARGLPLLVSENLHSYDSFRRWNRGSGAYAGVAYGHGSEFKGTALDLPRVCEELGSDRVAYFGDIDLQGLEIPLYARRVLGPVTPSLSLEPAARWYEALLAKADRAVPSGKPVPPGHPALDWLPASLRSRASRILAAGKRLPQELIGTEHLATMPGVGERSP